MISNMSTHIGAKNEDVASIVLMPGDPLRAKLIADTYLNDVTIINNVRNMLGFTGYYKNMKITVMGSGMGIPSMGIYSYELFDKYNVEYIIRIGTAGSYTEELDVYDTVLVDECYSESTYAYCQSLEKTNIEKPSLQLNKAILETAKKMGRKLTVAKAHSSDVYKREEKAKVLVNDAIQKEKCKCVEMESYALFHNAKVLNKQSYSYPLLDFVYPHVAHRRNGHFLVGWVYKPGGQEDVEKEQELWENGLAMIHREFEKYDNVILSDENIWHSSNGRKFPFWAKLMQDAKEHDYQVKVIVYIRRQDGLANSWLSQQVKEGWNTNATIKWDSFQRKTRKVVFNYYLLLEKIAEVTGRENIIVRIFDRKKFKGKDHTIFSDFLEAIGVDYTDDFKITEEEANRSLTGNSQEILRIVNTVLPDDDKVRTLVRQAAQDCENYKDPQNNFVMFSEEEFNKFMGRYEKWNEAIAKDYLHQEEPLFDMKRKEGERWTPENRFMYEDIVRFFGGVVIRQQRYIEALQKDINTLKESRLEAAKGLEDANVDEETKKILQSLSEQIINQQKDIQRALENSEKIDAVRDKNQEVKVRSLTVGNELIDLRQDYDALQKETKKDSKAIRQESKERDKELKAMIRELEQTSLWFRLRRKWRHITGKDK